MKKILEIESRSKLINYIYTCQLLEQSISIKKAFEEGDFSNQEISILENISLNQEKFIKLIKKFLKKSWPWPRIAPLIQAILIYGSYELSFQSKGQVINDLVTITKYFSPGDDFKFVNGILDNIGEFYVNLKNN